MLGAGARSLVTQRGARVFWQRYMPYVSLPTAFALAVPPFSFGGERAWRVRWRDDSASIPSDRMEQLVFGILREVLSPKDLIQLFTITDKELYTRSRIPAHCLLSVRRGQPRTVRATRMKRRGRKTEWSGGESSRKARRQRRLDRYRVAAWVRGMRLKFQDGRWCVAPPKWTKRQLRRLQERLKELRDPGEPHSDSDESKAERTELRLKHAKKPVFTAISRLLCFVEHGPPSEEDFGKVSSSEVLAVHHACEGSRDARARCLNAEHIAWGKHTDNAYHRVLHGALYDGRERKYRLPAKVRRPDNWDPPSQHPGFVRLRKRLSESGSRRLFFEGIDD